MALGWLLLGQPIQAQESVATQTKPADAKPQGEALTEIIVTARRRDEALQDVPVAVSYLSEDTLADAGVRRVTDLTSLVPNLSINSGYRQGSLWISLRGIPSVQGGEPPVTVLIDDVQVPGQDFINEELGEIQNIQVLRGPQGAIYGRGAIAGAILIDTERPTNEFSGNFDLLSGKNGDQRALISVSGPLVADRIFGRITIDERSTDGLQKDFLTGDFVDRGHGLNASGRLIFDLDDGLTIDLNSRQQQGIDGASYEYLVTNATRYDYNSVGPVNIPPVTDNHVISDTSAKVEKKFSDVTLTSITQYGNALSTLIGGADFQPVHLQLQNNRIQTIGVNQDLRLASNTDGPISWLVGVFGQNREITNSTLITADPLGPYPPGKIFSYSDEHDWSRAWAVYGQAVAKLPENFELSGALRYDSDLRKSFDPTAAADTTVEHTFDAVQPQITLSNKLTSEINAYATIGRGFRSGGFNPYADTVTLGVSRSYKSETDTNYELGLKTRWLDGALTANAAVFHTDFNNQQFFFISIMPIARDIFSVDKTSINGAEVEVAYTPIRYLTLTVTGGLNDSKIQNAGDGESFDGNTSPNSYKNTASGSITFSPPINEKLGSLFYVDWEHRGKTYWDVQNQYDSEPSNTFNGRVGLTYGKYQLTAYMLNISDERYPVLFQANAAGPGVAGELLNMPRTYGVELRGRF
jgi:iron complex outermembrane receptor protein